MKLIFENWRKTLSEGNLRMAHVKEVYPDKSPGEQTDIFEKYSKCSNVNNVAELRDVISGEITCQGKHLNEDSNSSKMIEKLNGELKKLTAREYFEGSGTRMEIDDLTEPGQPPKILAQQVNSEQEIVATSVWTDFPRFLKHFNKLIKGVHPNFLESRPEYIMWDLEEIAGNRAGFDEPGGYVGLK